MIRSPVLSPLLSKEALATQLENAAPGQQWKIHVIDQLPSTNDYLRKLDKTENSTQICATDWQTAGHGRRGKHWQSQRGNVTFTLRQRLQQPAVQLLGLSLVAGIAVVTILRERLGMEVSLKWPNDVLVSDGRKLGGLLIELLPVKAGSQATDVLTGIGINVRHQPEFDALGIGATSFEQQGLPVELDRNELIATIAASVASFYAEFENHGWGAFESRWHSVDALYGRQINVTGAKALSGKACGVSVQGALLVDTTAGIEEVVAGEVSVRPV